MRIAAPSEVTLGDVYEASGCTTMKDLLACIRGLQARVKFTESYESLVERLREITAVDGAGRQETGK